MTVWLTRPEDDSKILAEALAARGIASLVAPVMEIVISPQKKIDDAAAHEAILLTSRHAVHALSERHVQLPIYCVGEATAEAAKGRGYHHVITGEGDVLSLLPRIANDLRGKSLSYLSGEDVSVDVEALLASQEVRVERSVVYRAVAAMELPVSITQAFAEQSIDAVLFFSARTAHIANTLLTNHHVDVRSTDAYCLSLNVAQVAAALPWRRIHVASFPSAKAMLEML